MAIDEGFAVRISARTHPKSAPPVYSERDMVLAQRKAYLTGRSDESSAGEIDFGRSSAAQRNAEREEAARSIYPLPKVTRPRVVCDPLEPELRWTVRDGEPRLYDRDRPNCFMPTKARVALWADLLANPNEEVEDDT